MSVSKTMLTAVGLALAALVLTVQARAVEPAPSPAAATPADSADQGFQAWLDGVRVEALAQGISQATLERALGQVKPMEKVVELDRRQPEFVDTFLNYLDRRVTSKRVKLGRERLKAYRPLLRRVQAEYGVPAQYLVAFWAMETNYGAYQGSFPVIPVLATLAYDQRRGGFFRKELLAALAILDAGHIDPSEMKGSWAGAMGQMQFMPTTFLSFAVDGDGDGRTDPWTSLEDAMSSAANYLGKLGWRANEAWGRQVRLPTDFDWSEARLGNRRPVNAWADLGVRRADGKPLPRSTQLGSIVLPQGHGGPAFLVYDNFERIFTWNRSLNYALAVGHLADRLVGGTGLVVGRNTDNHRLSRTEALEIQTGLVERGLYDGPLDGMLGSRTRAAIELYQRQAGLPEDGHPSLGLLHHMHGTAPGRVIKAAAPVRSGKGGDNARGM